MLAGSLRLEGPWYIIGAEFNEEEPAIHIHVGVDKTAALCCPVCGAPTKQYGYELKERVWRHADCLFYPCYVHCKRPRVLCDKCGTVQVNAPFECKNSRFTLLFEGYAMLLLQDVPRARASRLLRCDEKSLAAILTYWVHDAVNRMDLSDTCSIAMDETSFRHGHKYVTVAIDEVRRRVFDVEPGRDKTAVKTWAKNWRGTVATRRASILSPATCPQATCLSSEKCFRTPNRPSTNFTSNRCYSKPWIRCVRMSKKSPVGKRSCSCAANCSWCRKDA